jgi:hypothetical protein
MTKQQELFINLCQNNKKCIWCKAKFDNIMLKTPNRIKPYDAYYWFTPEYLVHCQTTHGFDPETITDMIINVDKVGKK